MILNYAYNFVLYYTFFRRKCINPRMKILTARECCCSNGAAWGRYCQQCPREGSSMYKRFLIMEYIISILKIFYYFYFNILRGI